MLHEMGPGERGSLIVSTPILPRYRIGDRILARLTETKGDFAYEARLIRRIGTNPRRVLGIFRKTPEGGRILPIDDNNDWASGWAVDNPVVQVPSPAANYIDFHGFPPSTFWGLIIWCGTLVGVPDTRTCNCTCWR